MSTTTSTVADKIRSLLSLARSDNPHEAALAAQRAAELMERHGVDAATIEGAPEDPVADATVREDGSRVWNRCLVGVVAKRFFCEAWGNVGEGTITVVGRSGDVAAVVVLAAWLRRQLLAACVRAHRATPGSGNLTAWTTTFMSGAVTEIARRMREEAREAGPAPSSPPFPAEGSTGSTGASLTLSERRSLERYAQSASAAIAEWKRARNIFTRSGPARVRGRASAWTAGEAAGRSASLKAPDRALPARR